MSSSPNGSSSNNALVDQRILDMVALKAEQKKFAKLKKASRRLQRRYKKTQLEVDPMNPFCSEKRELDLQLQVARNQNPRLNEPFRVQIASSSPFSSSTSSRQKSGGGGGAKWSFQKQIDGASGVYSMAKVNTQLYNQPWVETPMAQLKQLGMNQGVAKRERWQRKLDKFNAALLDPDEAAQDTIENEARIPKEHKHRPGKYHVPGQDDVQPNRRVQVSALYPLMSVLELRDLLHNDPVHRPPPMALAGGSSGGGGDAGHSDSAASSSASSPNKPDTASVFNAANREALGIDQDALPKFHVHTVDEYGTPQSVPTAGGLHRQWQSSAGSSRKSKNGPVVTEGPSSRGRSGGARPVTHPSPAPRSRRGNGKPGRKKKGAKRTQEWKDREQGFDTRIIKSQVGNAFSGGNSRNIVTSPTSYHNGGTYGKISRFAVKAAGTTPSPFRTHLDTDFRSANQTNLVDQPAFLSVLSRKQIRKLLAEVEDTSGAPESGSDEDANDSSRPGSGQRLHSSRSSGSETDREDRIRLTFAESWLKQVVLKARDLHSSSATRRAFRVLVQGIDTAREGKFALPDDNDVMAEALDFRQELQESLPPTRRAGNDGGHRAGNRGNRRSGSFRQGSGRHQTTGPNGTSDSGAGGGGDGSGAGRDSEADDADQLFSQHAAWQSQVQGTKDRYNKGQVPASQAISALLEIREELRHATLPQSRALGDNIDHLVELIERRELEKLKKRRLQVEAGMEEQDSLRASRQEAETRSRVVESARVRAAVAELYDAMNALKAAKYDMSCRKRLQDAVEEAQAAGLSEGEYCFVDAQLLLQEVKQVSASDMDAAERELMRRVCAAEEEGDAQALLHLYSDEQFACLDPDSEDQGSAMAELRAALERVRANKLAHRTAHALAKSQRRSSTRAASVFTAVSSIAQLTTLRNRLRQARQALHQHEATLRSKLSNRQAHSAATLADAVGEARENSEPGALAFELNRAVLLCVNPAIISQAEELLCKMIGWQDTDSDGGNGLGAKPSAVDLMLAARSEPSQRDLATAATSEAMDPVDVVLRRLQLPPGAAAQLFRIVLQASLLGAAQLAEPEALRKLQECAQAEDFEVDVMDARGRTPLLLAVSLDGVPASIVSTLVELEADLYGGDRCREGALCSPLYTAVRQRNAAAIRALVAHLEPEEASEFLNYTPDCECYTPVGLATVLGASDIVACLLDAGAPLPSVDHPLESAEYTELDYALVACEFDVVNRMLDRMTAGVGAASSTEPKIDLIAQNILRVAHRFNVNVVRELGAEFASHKDEKERTGTDREALAAEAAEVFQALAALPQPAGIPPAKTRDSSSSGAGVPDVQVVDWLRKFVDAGGGSDRTMAQRFDLHFTMLASVVLSRLREFQRSEAAFPPTGSDDGADDPVIRTMDRLDSLVKPLTSGFVTRDAFIEWYVSHFRGRISAAARRGKIQFAAAVASNETQRATKKRGPAGSTASADDASSHSPVSELIRIAKRQGPTGFQVDYPQFLSACEANDVAEVVGLVVQCGADVHFNGTATEDPGLGQQSTTLPAGENKGVVRADVVDQHFTPLMIAANAGATEVCQALLNLNADVNAQAVDGSTALLLAAYRNHAQVVKCLVKHAGRTLDVTKRLKEDNAHALFVACQQGHVDVVRALVEGPTYELLSPGLPRMINAPVSYGAFPLYIAAALNHAEVVKLLAATPDIELDRYENLAVAAVDAENDDDVDDEAREEKKRANRKPTSQSALFAAVQHRHIEAITELVVAGADIHSQPTDAKMSPLMLAVYEGYHDIAALLLKVRSHTLLFLKYMCEQSFDPAPPRHCHT